ncbi:hypothetical protein Mal15_63210 [Stieleria maiorica]|uniref:Uncharacterized protein n=1 Tax=Stieleria maiorica TaxID=2795974 RepID=A0A5B9MQV3_9BACT|nr:hypothetical protein [Stieleria maiorica]QEG02235.1 hypothetical protein Mal15_63210 [Stieleria maiorica]
MNRMRQPLPIISTLLLSIGLIAITAAPADACQVPVFRYALERWPADNFELVVLHDGPLGDAESKLVDSLRDSGHQSSGSANCGVKVIEAGKAQDELLRSVWAQHGRPGQAVLASLYPVTAQEVPDRLIDAGPLDADTVANLVDSPIRQEIAKRLVAGESAVWIFVPCGDPKQDEVALKNLTRFVQQNETTLELPEQEEIEDEQALLEQLAIELRLDFSILTLHRDDPEEQFLLKMLLASEPDLEALDQPMAFPVLGRGRVLYGLVGKGISELTIGLASRFIIGPCSCQVKNQNPGFDLLMAVDWEKKIGTAKLSDPLPETTGAPVLLTIPPGRKAK